MTFSQKLMIYHLWYMTDTPPVYMLGVDRICKGVNLTGAIIAMPSCIEQNTGNGISIGADFPLTGP